MTKTNQQKVTKNTSDSSLTNWFLFEAVLALISSLIFGLTFRETHSLSSITQVQAQVLFASAIFTLVGIVGMIQILFFSGEEE